MGLWDIDLSSVRSFCKPLGKAVDKAAYAPAAAEDDPLNLAIDKTSGRLLVDGGVSAETPVTAHYVAVPAGTSGTIPSGAKGWAIAFLTGTGTLGGAAVPAGFSDSDTGTLAAAIPYTTATGSTAIVRYNT